MGQISLGYLTGNCRHGGPDSRDEHRRPLIGRCAVTEHRRHECVRVEFALKGKGFARLPGMPDRSHRKHEFPHSVCRLRPRHGEPPRDVRPDLAPESEREPPSGKSLEIGRDNGHDHRIASKRNGDARLESHALGRGRREHEGNEWVVCHFG